MYSIKNFKHISNYDEYKPTMFQLKKKMRLEKQKIQLTIYCFSKDIKYKNIEKVKIKDSIKNNKEKHCTAILVLNILKFEAKNIPRNKDCHFIIIKG